MMWDYYNYVNGKLCKKMTTSTVITKYYNDSIAQQLIANLKFLKRKLQRSNGPAGQLWRSRRRSTKKIREENCFIQSYLRKIQQATRLSELNSTFAVLVLLGRGPMMNIAVQARCEKSEYFLVKRRCELLLPTWSQWCKIIEKFGKCQPVRSVYLDIVRLVRNTCKSATTTQSWNHVDNTELSRGVRRAVKCALQLKATFRNIQRQKKVVCKTSDSQVVEMLNVFFSQSWFVHLQHCLILELYDLVDDITPPAQDLQKVEMVSHCLRQTANRWYVQHTQPVLKKHQDLLSQLFALLQGAMAKWISSCELKGKSILKAKLKAIQLCMHNDGFKSERGASVRGLIFFDELYIHLMLSQGNNGVSYWEPNAFYSPIHNKIILTPGLLVMFTSRSTHFQTVVQIVYTLAHEILHAFDRNGVQYDHKCRFKPDAFHVSDQDKISSLFDTVDKVYRKAYTSQSTRRINVHKTTNENYCDFFGVRLAFDVVATLFPDKQRDFFECVAKMRLFKTSWYYRRMTQTNDHHAHPKGRINIPFHFFKQFQKTFEKEELSSGNRHAKVPDISWFGSHLSL